MDAQEIIRLATSWLLSSGLRILIIVILALIALRLSKVLSNRLFSIFVKKGIEG